MHRNFLMDLLKGRVPRTLKGHKYAVDDPRYACIAEAIGSDREAFCDLAAREQGRVLRQTGPLVDVDPYAITVRITRSMLKDGKTVVTHEKDGVRVTITVQRA